MRPKLFNLCATVALLLCGAIVLLWVRSHTTMDLVHLRSRDRFYHVSTYRGSLCLGTWRRDEHDPPIETRYSQYPAASHDRIHDDYSGARRLWMFGFRYFAPPPNAGIATYRLAIVPFWFPLAAGALLPALRLRAWRRRQRRSAGGLCRGCGYDLRASPDRCPECGASTTGGVT